MMKEKKSPYVLDGNKVAVRDAAGDILEMVENVLDRYGIHVPDEDQTLDENNACLYGMTYSLLMDSIASVVADIVKDVNPEYTIEDCFAGKMGNQEEYFSIGRLQLVSGEFTQMLTISTMHISPKTVDLLDRTCDLVSKNRSLQNVCTVERRLKLQIIFRLYSRRMDTDGLYLLIRTR